MTFHVLMSLTLASYLFIELCQLPKDTWDPTTTIAHPPTLPSALETTLLSPLYGFACSGHLM